MDLANAEYPTRFETFTHDELTTHFPNEIPRDRGMYTSQFHPLHNNMAINMVKHGLYAKENTNWADELLPSNHNTLRQKLKTVKVDN